MTSRAVTLLGFAGIVGLMIVWGLIAKSRGSVGLVAFVARMRRNLLAQAALVAYWAWLGWHLFARGSGAFGG